MTAFFHDDKVHFAFLLAHLRLPFPVFLPVGAQGSEITPQADRQPGRIGRA